MTELLLRDWHGALALGPEPSLDALTLDGGLPPVTLVVRGGQLVWPWVVDPATGIDADATLTRAPVAVLDDLEQAQDWIWACYGSEAALALDAFPESDAVAWQPRWQWLAATAARFAFGHWLAVWWPASTLDGIPALDLAALTTELAPLATRLDPLLDATDQPGVPITASAARRDRYALAASGFAGPADALGAQVRSGIRGTDWTDCPPGWVDASESAVSWHRVSDLGGWSLRVRVSAGPQPPATGWLAASTDTVSLLLRPGRDELGACWAGESAGVGPAPDGAQTRVFLPGFGGDGGSAGPVDPAAPAVPDAGPSATETAHWRDQIRRFARDRIDRGAPPPVTPAALWRAEPMREHGHGLG
ncbi:hypothetical protein [Cellulomonas sp. NPDC089187]|uniref:hypothetical protein n=1 Tax=Cellulomonas sp. NPDC089187 TaxID=3154970 RepID=UPI0034317065